MDMSTDNQLAGRIRAELEKSGDKVIDLHLWRVGPGHLSAIISLASAKPQLPAVYKSRLACVVRLSHVTIEVQPEV